MPKLDARIAAYGTVDELNSHLGVVLAGDCPDLLRPTLVRIQNELFDVGADLAVPFEQGSRLRIEQEAIGRLEGDRFEELQPLTSFVLPGGIEAGAGLRRARGLPPRGARHGTAGARAR